MFGIVFLKFVGKLEAMKKTICCFYFILFFSIVNAQVITSGFEWQRCYGSVEDEDARQLLKISEEEFILGNDPSFDYCFEDIWLTKINSSGDILWENCVSGGFLHSIYKTTDHGYIMSGTAMINTFDIFITKTDSLGNLEWQNTIGGSESERNGSIIQLQDGNYAVAGNTDSDDGDVIGWHGPANIDDAWVIKLNTVGEIIWQKCIGGTSGEYVATLKETPDNGLIFLGTTNSNDGDISGYHGGYSDLLVVKLDSSGNIEWQKCFGGTDLEDNGESNEAIEATTDGGYIITGRTTSIDGDVIGNHGGEDAFVIKIDSLGEIQWQKCYGGTGRDLACSVKQMTDGGFLFGGKTTSNDGDVIGNRGNFDAWMFKTDSIGNMEWQKTVGGSDYDIFRSVMELADGSFIAAGETWSTDFDVSGNHGGQDVWVVKFKPLILNFDSIAAINCTGDSGYIGISVNSGTPPYSYSWDTNPIQTTEDISNLSAGVYTVTVTDAEGITVTGSALVNGPSTFNGVDLAGHFTTTVFRPGIETTIFIDVSNQGCFPLNGTVVFVLDPWLNYVDAVPPPDSISGDSLFWNLDALTYDSLHFTPVVTVTTDITAQIGDSVCISLIVLPIESDGDNLQTMCYPIVNSYDPNDKQVSPQGFSEHGFIANNQRMYYTVRFQNTGNAEALNVYILDTLNANLDFQTLQVYSSSHTMTTELLPDNVLKFRFDDIHLPDSNANEPASHGYVMYEIDQLPDLAVDTEIKNTAYIYFDFNPPVITNTVLNTIYDCSSSFNEPFITASGPLTFCDGENITLDAGAGYDEYEWSNGETTQSISIDTTGDYSVAVRVDTCWHYSDTVELEAHTFEVPVSENGQLLISDSAFVSYQWYLNGEPIINAVYQTHCAQEFGNYFVVVTDDYGCTDTSHVIEHGINTPPCDIGINEPENTFTIYPNPATTELTIVGYNPASLKLCNTLGQTVTEAYNTNKLQIAELSKGLYLLQVFDESGALLKTEKVVKK